MYPDINLYKTKDLPNELRREVSRHLKNKELVCDSVKNLIIDIFETFFYRGENNGLRVIELKVAIYRKTKRTIKTRYMYRVLNDLVKKKKLSKMKSCANNFYFLNSQQIECLQINKQRL